MAYEDFVVQSANLFDGTDTLIAAKELYIALETTVAVLEMIGQNLEMEAQTNVEDQKFLSVLLSAKVDFTTLVNKLISLDTLYKELCFLINVSPAEHPLNISKVESGSLWIKVFGESRVISLLTSLLESWIQFVYRNYTREGKIFRNIQLIESILDLDTKIKKGGYNNSVLKAEIQKSSVIAAQKLNTLLEGEPEVTLNGQLYSLNTSSKGPLLEGSSSLLLKEGTTDDVN
jgi:hypothetical protein